ncbi:methyltransferase [Pseudomonas mangrovi]|uniref:SAM-dependent methyltransferase n=1 Tax=Pseudomonas mangrovi TaxID=2161748 RepID=A0A2T5P976_9PSED|nr:methyltransferase [Pseudomonas mangrovi]PTU74277.1 SAM-dependent methyltransferase [Pseudomonas mangrovi]
MAAVLAGEQLAERFRALDAFLVEHQQLWRPRPFHHLQLPWEAGHRELADWLRARSLTQAEQAHNSPECLDAPAPFPQLAQISARLSAVGELPQQVVAARNPRLAVDVPGRKLEQIQAFAAALDFDRAPRHWLDWCAGKGHLGRWLAQDGATLTCLEWDAALCSAGESLSQRHGHCAVHAQQDVMAADVQQHLNDATTAVALHACGDLHVRLLQVASAAGSPQLAVAPCCYNRTRDARYQALSQPANESSLRLDRDDLALPLSETVTAGARTRRQRDQSMAWRLGFDLLQRQLRGSDDYLPTPSLEVAWLGRPFAEYCRHLAALKQLALTGEQPWAQYEAAGWQRLAQVRNLELLRGLFRRPLEIWLLLDRALYLQERGYEVRLGRFCEYRLSPRNLLLLAQRPACG